MSLLWKAKWHSKSGDKASGRVMYTTVRSNAHFTISPHPEMWGVQNKKEK